MPTADLAICLRVSDYSETSQVVTFLTREGGLLRLLAKGSKRAKSKSAGAIDLFSQGECVYTLGRSGSLGTLIEFAETVSRPALRKRLDRLNVGLYMLEICTILLGPSDPYPEIFDLLSNALNRLCQPDASPQAVLAYFQWRVLRHVGLLGQMDTCVNCGRKIGTKGVYFSSSLGGLLCRDCESGVVEKYAVSPSCLSAIAALSAAEAGKRPTLPDKQARAINALLAYHIEFQSGREIKSARGVLDEKKKGP